MAQAQARIATRSAAGRDRGVVTQLLKAAGEGLARAYRTSRDRQEIGRAMSIARVGRETGVKC